MDLVGLSDAARRLGVAKNTVWRWSKLEGFPPPVGVIGGHRVWRIADIERFARARPGPGRPPAD